MEILIIILIFSIFFNTLYVIPKKLNSQDKMQSLMLKELTLRLTNIENKIDFLYKEIKDLESKSPKNKEGKL